MAEGSGAAVVETATAVHDGWNLAGEGAAEAVAAIKAEEADAKGADGEAVSKAASELGRKGGKAAAEARAKAAKEAPEPAAKEPAKDTKAAPEPAEADDEPEDDAPDAKRSRARQRVEEATRKAAEERREREKVARERDEWKARAERIEREHQAPQPEPRRAEPEQDGPPEPPEPKAEDFEDYNQYQRALKEHSQALVDYRVETKIAALQRENAQRAQAVREAQATASKVEAFQAKAAEAALTPEVLGFAEQLHPSFTIPRGPDGKPVAAPNALNVIADQVLEAPDVAPAVLQYLAENPREFQRIAELDSARDVVREMGRLIGRFEARAEGATAGSSPSSGSPASKPASKAPPPVRPVTGAPSAAAGDYFREGEDFDSWNRRQRAAGR